MIYHTACRVFAVLAAAQSVAAFPAGSLAPTDVELSSDAGASHVEATAVSAANRAEKVAAMDAEKDFPAAMKRLHFEDGVVHNKNLNLARKEKKLADAQSKVDNQREKAAETALKAKLAAEDAQEAFKTDLKAALNGDKEAEKRAEAAANEAKKVLLAADAGADARMALASKYGTDKADADVSVFEHAAALGEEADRQKAFAVELDKRTQKFELKKFERAQRTANLAKKLDQEARDELQLLEQKKRLANKFAMAKAKAGDSA